MTYNFNLRSGTIIYNDLANIKTQLPFENQSCDYKEDLLQIGFGYHYCVDVSWLPEADPTGSFIVRVIENFNWSAPLFIKKTKKLNIVFQYIDQAIEIADALSTAPPATDKRSSYFISQIDLQDGKILYNNFFIDPTLSYEDQPESYRGDLVQIDFGSTYYAHLGWTPEYNPSGYFEIHVIKNNNWDKPVWLKKTKIFNDMIIYFNEAMQLGSQLNKLMP
jgi:hypothetical protein